MKTSYIIISFVIVALIQIFVPMQMILHRESIIKDGKAYKFKTTPIDPSDPFKGKYVYLNYELNSFVTRGEQWKRGQDIYVSIATDSLDYAYATGISEETPQIGDYVVAMVSWNSGNSNKVNFTFPFNEYYMEETKAYKAEVAHRDAQRDSIPNNTYAIVYIKEGEAVLHNVFINDIPLSEFVE